MKLPGADMTKREETEDARLRRTVEPVDAPVIAERVVMEMLHV